jgi:hypothetical protein
MIINERNQIETTLFTFHHKWYNLKIRYSDVCLHLYVSLLSMSTAEGDSLFQLRGALYSINDRSWALYSINDGGISAPLRTLLHNR